MTASIWTKFRFWSFFADTQLWPHINEPRAVYESSERGTVNYVDGNHVWFIIFGDKSSFFFLGFFGFVLWCVEKGRKNSIVPNGIFLLSPQNLKFRIFNGMVGLFWSSGHVPLFDWVGMGSIPRGRNFFLIPKDNFWLYFHFFIDISRFFFYDFSLKSRILHFFLIWNIV